MASIGVRPPSEVWVRPRCNAEAARHHRRGLFAGQLQCANDMFLVNRLLLIPDLLFGVFYQEIFRGIGGPVVRERVTPHTSTWEFYQITLPVSIVSFVVCGNGARRGALTMRLSLKGLSVSCSGDGKRLEGQPELSAREARNDRH